MAIAWLSLWGALIAVGGTLGALTAYKVVFLPLRQLLAWRRRALAAFDQRGWERLHRLEDAHTAWLDAATGCAGELSLMPPDPEWLKRRPPKPPTAGDYFRTKLAMRAVYGRDNETHHAALRRATARVRSLSPSDEAQAAMDEAMDFLAEWGKEREPEWANRWPDMHQRVIDTFQRDRDAVAPRLEGSRAAERPA